ncbi:hypothetical protein RRG08_023195 [Elysia crispata]|uniref:Uncharacterized protein n=1 Tax=Elysia crispata TaxID=231223 RepID=A0AAE1DL16_9GAST|nr:hypothetical protein RRG08_023195 [Elysia crispata]
MYTISRQEFPHEHKSVWRKGEMALFRTGKHLRLNKSSFGVPYNLALNLSFPCARPKKFVFPHQVGRAGDWGKAKLELYRYREGPGYKRHATRGIKPTAGGACPLNPRGKPLDYQSTAQHQIGLTFGHWTLTINHRTTRQVSHGPSFLPVAGEGSLGWKTDKDPCIISRRNIDRLSPLIALGLILSQHTHCHFSIEGAGSGMEAAEHILYGSAGCQ